MRPILSCLIAITLLPGTVGAITEAAAAPAASAGFSGGVRPGSASGAGLLNARPFPLGVAEVNRRGFDGRRGRVDRFRSDRADGRRGRLAFGGYGLLGWPFLGSGQFGSSEGDCGRCPERPVLPSAVGILPSPVLPPAIYVIGEGKRARAAAPARR